MAEAELHGIRNVNRPFDGQAGADVVKSGTAKGTERSELLLRELDLVMSLVEPAQEEIKRLYCQPRLQSPTELHAQLEKATTENARLQHQITEINNGKYTEYDDLFKKLQQANAQIQELEASKRNSEAELIAKHKEEVNAYKDVNSTTEERLQEAYKEKENLKNMNARLNTEASKKIKEKEQENARLSHTITSMREERKKLEEDLTDTKTRLSKLMGDKLANNNPDIADLSDNNRPTKIAEKYQELYDNQWTDAFEMAEQCFTDKNEKHRIQILRKLLLDIYSACEMEFFDQDRELMQALYRKDKVKNDIPDNIKKPVKEMKRQTSRDAIDNIAEKFIGRFDTATELGTFIAKVKKFVHESVSICWHMLLQDPPLVFHLDEVKVFDSSKYKAYTVTGTRIDFVVWPPLLLFKKGLILTKGIAQCVRSFQGSKSVRNQSRQVSAADVAVSTGSLRTTGAMGWLHDTKGNESVAKSVAKSTEETLTSQISDLKIGENKNMSNFNQETYVLTSIENDKQDCLKPERHQHDETCSQRNETKHGKSGVRSGIATTKQQAEQPSQMHRSGAQGQPADYFQPYSQVESPGTNQYFNSQHNQSSSHNLPHNDNGQQHAQWNFNQKSQPGISQQSQKTFDDRQQLGAYSQSDIAQINPQTKQQPIGQYPSELMPTQYEWDFFCRLGAQARYYLDTASYARCQNYYLWLNSRQYH